MKKLHYEKVFILKADDYVKSKAMDKLKEINSSKNGSNAKAQQYLDGLLNVLEHLSLKVLKSN